MADEAASSALRRPAGWSPPARFTALELVAAEQLIHLSESSCSSGAPAALSSTPRGFGVGGGGGGMLLLPASGATADSAASSSASPRSVNNAPPPQPPVGAAVAAEEDDEQEVGGRRRRNKRYRSIAEIYAATEPNKPIGGRRRKAADRTRTTDGAVAATKEEARK